VLEPVEPLIIDCAASWIDVVVEVADIVLVVMFDMTGWSLASGYVVSIRASLQADPPPVPN
jgi:hypothetical protein